MLLDVNVLLALAWPNHQFHSAAKRWFAGRAKRGWATCALTELGFIRVSSNRAFTEHAKTPAEAAAVLQGMISIERHRYVSDLPPAASLAEVWRLTAGHRQTTDVYLAFVARHHGTKLATFDGPLSKHPQVGSHVELLPVDFDD